MWGLRRDNYNYYLPACCRCWREGDGKYVVGHNEHSPRCKHTPSGGTGGYADGKTPCNRIIGQGKTKIDAIESAREYLSI